MFEPTYLLHSRIAWLTQTERRVAHAGRRVSLLGGERVARPSTSRPDVVFVCSPNNPTGQRATGRRRSRRSPDAPTALVIVDEAYIEFGGSTCLPLVADHPNVVVTRTMSKAFALAGARIGYALASPEVVEDLQRVRLPYHLSAITQAAGVAALRHAKEAVAILDAIRDERDRILAALARDARRDRLPVRRELRAVRAAEARRRRVAGAAGSRRADPRPLAPSSRTRSA